MGQGWLVFKLSGSAMMLGYLGAATAIPAIALTLFGGALADQLNKKAVLMTTSLIVALLLAVLAILDVAQLATAWLVILIAALISVVSGLDWPTRQSIFPLLIEREDMMSAVALNSIIWQSCRMIIPAIGGIVIAYMGTWIIFVLCAAGFLTMFVVIFSLDISTTTDTRLPAFASTMNKIAEGLGFILSNKIFLVLIGLSYAGMFFVSSYMQLLPAFSELLEAGEAGYGYLISITGVGSVVGTILVGSFQESRRLGRAILGSAFLSGLSVYLFSAATSYAITTDYAYPLAMIAGFTIALFSSIFMITSMTVLQLQVPDVLRGRVMGLHGITYSLMPLGGLLTGFVSTLVSAPAAITLSATVYLLIVLSIGISQVQIRRIDGSSISLARLK
jgi:MFS family permease